MLSGVPKQFGSTFQTKYHSDLGDDLQAVLDLLGSDGWQAHTALHEPPLMTKIVLTRTLERIGMSVGSNMQQIEHLVLTYNSRGFNGWKFKTKYHDDLGDSLQTALDVLEREGWQVVPSFYSAAHGGQVILTRVPR